MHKLSIKTFIFATLFANLGIIDCHSWIEQVSLVEDVAFQNSGYLRDNGRLENSLNDKDIPN